MIRIVNYFQITKIHIISENLIHRSLMKMLKRESHSFNLTSIPIFFSQIESTVDQQGIQSIQWVRSEFYQWYQPSIYHWHNLKTMVPIVTRKPWTSFGMPMLLLWPLLPMGDWWKHQSPIGNVGKVSLTQ